MVNESRLVPGTFPGFLGDMLGAGVRLLGVRWRTGAVFRLPPAGVWWIELLALGWFRFGTLAVESR